MLDQDEIGAMEVEALYMAGLRANREGKTRLALRTFRTAMDIAPLDVRILLSAANMHLKLGEVDAGAALTYSLLAAASAQSSLRVAARLSRPVDEVLRR
eukprot:5066067-Pleurochrysis_carterae.AAC.3